MKTCPILIIVLSSILALALTAGMVALARGQQAAYEFNSGLDTATSTSNTARLYDVAVGLVVDGVYYDTGSNFPEGYNWLSYQGLLRAENELGVVGTVYTPTNSTDYEVKLQECVDDGNDLCISVGFLMADATANVAAVNPDTYFSLVDWFYESYQDNVRGMWFAYDEMGYIAGTLAGLMTHSDVVGDIGGWPVPTVVDLVEGYRNGAQCANPEVDVLAQYISDWLDPELGATVAQEMIDQGTDVVFATAGPTGVGAVLTTTQSGVWGMGVDTDWYISVFDNGAVDGSDKLLSSAMKRMDNAVFDTISDVVSGTFTSGTVLYNLEVEGVGLAPFHEVDPDVSQSVRDALNNVEQGIINGTIDVNDSCRDYIYLPMIMH